MKQYLTFALILVLSLALVSSEVSVSSETHQLNKPTDLKFLCTINGAIPSAAAEMNISITDREGNYLVRGQIATPQGKGRFNYTVTFTKSETYKVQMGCTDGAYSFSDEAEYLITGSGFTSTIGFFIIFILIIVLVFVMGVSLKNNWIMMLGSFLVLLLGFFVIINGVDIIKDTRTTWALGLIIWALGIYFIFLSVEEQLKEWN